MNKGVLFPFYIDNYALKKRNNNFFSSLNSDNSNLSSSSTSDSLIINALRNNQRIKKNIGEYILHKNFSKEKNIEDVNKLYSHLMKEKLRNLIPTIKSRSKSNDIIFNKEPISKRRLTLSHSFNFRLPSNISKEIDQEILIKKKITSPKNFGKLCVKLRYIKNIMKFNKEYCDKEEKKRNKIEKEINFQVKFWKKKYENLINYKIPNFTGYIVYLREYIKKENKNLDELRIKMLNLINKNDILQNKINQIMLKYIKYTKIRNILICIKENINLEDLPPIFNDISYETMMNLKEKAKAIRKKKMLTRKMEFTNIKEEENENVKSEEIKNNNIENNLYDSRNKKKNKIENKRDKSNYDYLEKYLFCKYPIFDNLKEITYQFQREEKKIFRLYQNYYFNYCTCEKLKKELEKEKEIFNKNKINIQQSEIKLNNELTKLKSKNKELLKKIKFIDKSQNKNVKRSLNKYISKIPKELPIDFCLSILRLNNYYNEKQFKVNFAYTFFYIAKITKKLYSIKKNLFYETYNELIENTFFDMLNILENPDKYKEINVLKNAILVLQIYDKVVLNLIMKYKSFIFQMKDTEFCNNVLKEKRYLKALNIMEKKRNLNEEMKIKKNKKYIEKHHKTFFLSRCKSFFNFRYEPKKLIKNNDFQKLNYNSIFY